MPADPLPVRPEALGPLLLRASEAECGDLYRQHLFDQYKLFVEMADRLSAWRMQTIIFFLGISTALLSILASLLKDHQITTSMAIPIVIALLLMCGLWWWIVRYRHLLSVKFEVILAMEASLPLAPYTEEWQALGGRKELRRHLPLSSVEKMVPLLFVLLYAAL